MPEPAAGTATGFTYSVNRSDPKSNVAGVITVTPAVSLTVTPSRVTVAVMIADGSAGNANNAVTTPVFDTATLPGLLDSYVTPVRSVSGLPLASSPVATSCAVVPIPSIGVGFVSTTDASLRRTVTVTVPATDAVVAVIVATPSPTAVIVALSPDPDTVATAGASVVHVSDGDGTTDWSAAFTTAVTPRVSPADARSPTGESVSTTDAAACPGYVT